MKKNLSRGAREYVVSLLEYDGRRPLAVLCEDSCSEVSRLLGLWFRKKLPKARIFIAQGKIGKRRHDLLVVENGRDVDVVNPTVWQFFKYKKTMVMARAKTTEDAIGALAEMYGGTWRITERVSRYAGRDMARLKAIIKKQIR